MSTQTQAQEQVRKEYVTLEKITDPRLAIDLFQSKFFDLSQSKLSLALELAHSSLFDNTYFMETICGGVYTRKANNDGYYYKNAHPNVLLKASERLRADVNFISTIIDRGHCSILLYAHESVRKNRDIAFKALSVSPSSFEYIHDDFKNDIEFVKIAVEKYNVTLNKALEKFSQASDVFGKLDPEKDKKKIKEMIKKSPESYLKMPEHIRDTMEFAIVAARHGSATIFAQMPEKFRKSKTVVKAGLEGYSGFSNAHILEYKKNMHESLWADLSMVSYIYENIQGNNLEYVSESLKNHPVVLFNAYKNDEITLEQLLEKGFDYRQDLMKVCDIVDAKPLDYVKMFDHSIDIESDTDQFNRQRAHVQVLRSVMNGLSRSTYSNLNLNNEEIKTITEVGTTYLLRMDAHDRLKVFNSFHRGFIQMFPEVYKETLEIKIKWISVHSNPISVYKEIEIEHKLNPEVLLAVLKNNEGAYQINDINKIIKKEFGIEENYLDRFKVEHSSKKWVSDYNKIVLGLEQEIERIKAGESVPIEQELQPA